MATLDLDALERHAKAHLGARGQSNRTVVALIQRLREAEAECGSAKHNMRLAELRIAKLERVREAALANTRCWLDIDPDDIEYVSHELGEDCPGCALRAALAAVEEK